MMTNDMSISAPGIHVSMRRAPSRADQILSLRDLIRTEDRFVKKQKGSDGVFDKDGARVSINDSAAYRFSIWCAALWIAFPEEHWTGDGYDCIYDLNEELLWSIEGYMKKLGIEQNITKWAARKDVSHQDVIDVLEVVAEMEERQEAEYAK